MLRVCLLLRWCTVRNAAGNPIANHTIQTQQNGRKTHLQVGGVVVGVDRDTRVATRQQLVHQALIQLHVIWDHKYALQRLHCIASRLVRIRVRIRISGTVSVIL